jgi:hypothetical protein
MNAVARHDREIGQQKADALQNVGIFVGGLKDFDIYIIIIQLFKW